MTVPLRQLSYCVLFGVNEDISAQVVTVEDSRPVVLINEISVNIALQRQCNISNNKLLLFETD